MKRIGKYEIDGEFDRLDKTKTEIYKILNSKDPTITFNDVYRYLNRSSEISLIEYLNQFRKQGKRKQSIFKDSACLNRWAKK